VAGHNPPGLIVFSNFRKKEGDRKKKKREEKKGRGSGELLKPYIFISFSVNQKKERKKRGGKGGGMLAVIYTPPCPSSGFRKGKKREGKKRGEGDDPTQSPLVIFTATLYCQGGW